jgi:hypothetical protein
LDWGQLGMLQAEFLALLPISRFLSLSFSPTGSLRGQRGGIYASVLPAGSASCHFLGDEGGTNVTPEQACAQAPPSQPHSGNTQGP